MDLVSHPSSGYLRRVIDDELDDLLGDLPAVLLDGPKGVGKTSTALRRCRTVRRLDVPAERDVIAADPSIISVDPEPVLIDEWHRVPEVWDAVRMAVDSDPRGGRFVLTGSARRQGTHSGAGRITTMRMRPLALAERGLDPTVSLSALLRGEGEVAGRTDVGLVRYVEEITSSGFPGLRGANTRAVQRQLDSYLDRIVDHDLAEEGFRVRRPATVTAWLRAYAAATGTTASWEKIRRAALMGVDAPPARSTTQPYIELLTALRILDTLPAWMPSDNHLGPLSQQPRHFLADPALSARLVKRSATRLLGGDGPEAIQPRDGGFLGGLFEALAVMSIRTYAQSCDATVHHLRTANGGREVDIIVEGDDGVLGIEVKLSSSIEDRHVRHLVWLRDNLGDECIDTLVVHTGPEAYRRSDGVGVVPLALLGA